LKEIIFVSQNIVLALFLPVSITILLCVTGLIMWRRPRRLAALVTGGIVWLLIMSTPLTSLILIKTLESKTTPYADAKKLADTGVRYIVVLSGGFNEGDLTAADKLGASVLRLLEGRRLWREVPDCKLVLTGGKIPGLSRDMSIAQAMRNMAVEMGIPEKAIIMESESWRTEDQARLITGIVGSAPFALVTSAYHMPRSVLIFRQFGLEPIPAPCDFQARKICFDCGALMPQAGALALSQTAMKEYLATWAATLKVKIMN
jgi:uncharacterized SAM-binding protein YcdF (DUF218 family)